MRRISTPLVALATAAVFALGGCGDGDGETTTATSNGSDSQQGATSAQGQESKREGAAEQDERSSADKAQKEDTAPRAAPQEGSKAAAPGVPTSKGGDNSIQTYGLESGSEERAEATAAVQAFLDARAAANWARACSLLAAEQRKMFEQLAKGSKKRGNAACAEVMAAFASEVPAGAFAEEADIVDVLSLRVGEYAFLIYTRPDGKIYATAITREGGAWKIISVGPTQLS